MIDRTTGLGASEVAATLGLSSFATPFDIWARKTTPGLGGMKETSRMKWGKMLQRAIAEGAGEERGYRAVWFDRIVRHKSNPLILASPDALATDRAETEGFWMKEPHGEIAEFFNGATERENIAFTERLKWGFPEDTDGVPDEYRIQCAWQMAATNLPWVDVAALFGGSDLRLYRIDRDLEFEGNLIQLAEKWWRDHVVANVAPQIEDTETARAWLNAKHPRNVLKMRIADEEEQALIWDYASQRRTETKHAAMKEESGIILRQIIGDHDGVQSEDGKVRATWKRNKDSSETDWEKIANDLGQMIVQLVEPGRVDEAIAACFNLKAAHTKTVPGSRVLRVTVKE